MAQSVIDDLWTEGDAGDTTERWKASRCRAAIEGASSCA